jgi:localization factor PodJL
MRAELPWNVAGIPAEARDAARAAARREGLSVGEWLTRRILRSFSDFGEVREMMPDRSQLDAWGLPQSAASRRDTEEMLARVSRSELESGDVYRRIEEQLRGVARRLDSSERSQSESNRVLSRTAAEMNIAAREQSQAFEQMSLAVTTMDRRLETLEQARGHESLKEAVKGLHLGLSRLADQITQTASQSGNQIAMVAGNLEQVATRLTQVRDESENTTQTLDLRLSTVERSALSGAAAIGQAVERLEQRLGGIEASAEEAISRGIEKLEQRLGQVERHAGETVAPGLQRVEQRLEEIEKISQQDIGPSLERLGQRLEGVEQAAGEMLGAGLQQFDQRLDAVEKSILQTPGSEQLEERLGTVEKSAQVSADALDHTQGKLDTHAQERGRDRAEFESHAAQVQEALMRLEEWLGRLQQHAAEKSAAAAQAPDPETADRLDNIERTLTDFVSRPEQSSPVAELEDGMHVLAGRIESLEKNLGEMLSELHAGLTQAAAPPPAPEAAAVFSELPDDAFGSVPPPPSPEPSAAFSEMADPYASVSPPPFQAPAFHALAEEAPPFVDPAFATQQDNFADLGLGLEHPFEEQPAAEGEPEAPAEDFLAAARRSARAAAEKAQTEKRGRPFSWSSERADGEAPPRARLIVLGGFGLLVVLVLAAALLLSHRSRMTPVNVAQTVPAAKSKTHQLTSAKQMLPQMTAPSKARLVPAQPHDARHVPAKSEGTMTLDRAIQMANAGNPIAQTVLGLHYLDGDGGAVANPVEAAKWLAKAAAQGQAVAQYRYGTLLERGQGISADPAKAVHWYLAAAAQGNRKAMHNLAVAYAEGTGGKKDMAEAAPWFAKAAALGLPDSQFNLAVLYERGDGVPQSLIDAYKWYAIAATQGDIGSRQRLSVLGTQLSAPDRAAAQRSAAGFHAAPLNRSANVAPEIGDLAN